MGRKRGMPGWLAVPATIAMRSGLAVTTLANVKDSTRVARVMARRFGSAPFNRKRLVRGINNLKLVYPDWSHERCHEVALNSYEHLFMLGVETAYAPRFLTPDAWAQHVQFANLGDALRHLMSGRPAIMVTGHAGNWEVLGYTMALLGFPIHALYRPLDLKPLDAWVRRTRNRRGLNLVDKFGAAEELPHLLDNGAAVAFAADQNAGGRGLYVPFFNRLASSYKSIGLLAMRYEAPIICGHARRLESPGDLGTYEQIGGFREYHGEAFRYRVEVPDVILPEHWADQPDPLFYITARYRRAIETMVHTAPSQYLWMHRYWKSRPRHEVRDVPMPASLIRKLESLPWMTEADLRTIVDRSDQDRRLLDASKDRRVLPS